MTLFPLALASLLLLPGTGAPISQQPVGPTVRRPNVLFYLIDTCRADRMDLYGHDRQTTPFLSSLAKRSVVFERCLSQAPWTKPSMGSILTSRYPSETAMVQLLAKLPGDHITFAERLKDAGYYTAAFSANPIMGRMSNYNQGFRWFLESAQVNNSDPIKFASGSARKLNEKIFPWLDDSTHESLLLYVHSVDPHEEYEPSTPYLETFADPDAMPRYRREWKTLLESRPQIPGNHVTAGNFAETGLDPDWFIRQGKDLYDADILANDRQIERLYEKLQQQGWGDDLILIITSDHGEEFFEHGGTCHGYSLYRELIHVPLLIHAPGLLPEGLRIDTPVRSIDIHPTLVDLLGLEMTPGISGRSLLPLVRDPDTWKPSPVFSEKYEDEMSRLMGDAPGVAISMVDGPWKYVLNLRSPTAFEKPRHELFDTTEDPWEQDNLAERNGRLIKQFERDVMRWSSKRLGPIGEVEEQKLEDLPEEMLEALRQLGYIR